MNNSKTTVVKSKGIGTFGLLGIVFIVLKLTGHITWSWLWVTAPFWGGIALGLGIMIMVFLFGLLAIGIKSLVE